MSSLFLNEYHFNIIINRVVCSDLMARGLDISAIDAIINYDVPEHIKVVYTCCRF